MKLHIAAITFTGNAVVDDAPEAEALMSRINKPVKRFMEDGAYR